MAETDERPVRLRVAKVLTEVLSPVVIIVLVTGVVAWHSASTPAQALAWSVVVAGFGAIIPLGYILRGVRRGRWDDHHVPVRAHRRLPFLFGIGCCTVAAVLVVVFGAPADVRAMTVSGLVSLAIATLITVGLKWKVSIHALVAAGSAAMLVIVFGPALVASWPLAAAICWSRVELRAHTTAQTVAGAALGILMASTVFPLLR